MDWQVADAKNRFSELITRALTVGPQRVCRRGQAVIIMSEDEYRRLSGEQETLKDVLLSTPDLGDLDVVRDESPMREFQW